MKKIFTASLYFIALTAILPLESLAKENIIPADNKYQKAPLVFLENKGQVIDGNGRQRNDINFRIPGQDVNIFVQAGQLHYQWNRINNTNAVKGEEGKHVDVYRLDVSLVGANSNAQLVKEDKDSYVENYYLPQCPNGASAESFKKITYKNIYPGIDWVLYNSKGHLKYDFIVHSNGNPSDIKLKYSGNTGREVTTGGDVRILTPFGSITEQKLLCYNAATGKQIPSSFTFNNDNTVSFKVANYDGTLVIDPQVEWSTYYGGSVLETGYTVATDTSGGAYLGGFTTSTANIATSGSHQTSLSASRDAYVVKFSKTCTRVWATYYGGSGDENFFSSAIDTNNNIYLAGITNSAGLATGGSHQPSIGGGTDCYIVKFSQTGTRIWATYYGGTDNESQVGEHQVWIGCDSKNNIYLCGNSTSSGAGIISTPGSFQQNLSGGFDGFLARFNDAGVRQWGTYYGGSASDKMTKIVFDLVDNIYITGETKSSSGIATTGSHQPSYGSSSTGSSDAFLVKFKPNGQRVWGTYYGGTYTDLPEGLATDVYGYVYVSGSTNSYTGISTSGAFQVNLATTSSPNPGGDPTDCFLVKFDTAGVRQWGTYYGGPSVDHCGDMAMDAFGNICFTGYTGSETGIATPGVSQPTFGGGVGFDAFLAIFTLSGIRYWASYIGGTATENGWGLKYSKLGDLYLAGTSASTNNIATSASTGAFQTSLSGSQDAFLTKYQADTSTFIIYPFNVSNICAGDTFEVNYGITNPFRSGNVFYVQLSNASGSFANPDTIGSRASTTTGTIKCYTKVNTPGGTGYRIRIVSSKPASTSLENIYNITIRTLPVKPLAGSNTPVCSDGAPLNLTVATPTPGVNFTWVGPNSFGSNAQNPTITTPPIAATGDYIVTAELNGCSTKDTTSVVVNITPAKPTLGSNSPVCSGGTLNLTSSTTTTGVTYSWTGPDAFGSTSQNPSRNNVSSLSAGYYVVTASRIACTSTDSILVAVNPTFTPMVTTSVAPTDTICDGDTLTFSGIGTGGGTTPTYQWQKNGVDIVGQTTPFLTYDTLADNDIITLIYKGSGPCLTVPADTSDPITITVRSALVPAVGISATPGFTIPPNTQVTFMALDTNGGPAPLFKWFKNGIEIPGAITNILPQIAGLDVITGDQICVTMISSISCAEPDSASACTQLLEVTGINKIAKNSGLSLYPNPNNGSFTVKGMMSSVKELSLDVVNALGQVVYTETTKPSNKELNKTINLADNLPAGVYLLRVRGEELKLIKFTLTR